MPSEYAATFSAPTTTTIVTNTPTTIQGLSISDIDDVGGSYNVSIMPSHGTLSLGTTDGLTFYPEPILGTVDMNNLDQEMFSAPPPGSLFFGGSLADVNAALASLVFTPDADYTGPSSFLIEVDDPDTEGRGVHHTANTYNFNVGADVDDPPSITNVDGDIAAYTEELGPVHVDVNMDALVADDGANFGGGTLQIAITTNKMGNQDVIAFDTEDTGVLFGESDDGMEFTVIVDDVIIGTMPFEYGAQGDNISIAFNADATASAIEKLLHTLTYNNILTTTLSEATRTVEINLTDSAGNLTTVHSQVTVDDTPEVNHAPVIDLNGAANTGDDVTAAYNENGPAFRFAPLATASDADAFRYNGGSVTVSIAGALTTDTLSLINQGTAKFYDGVVDLAGSIIATYSGGTNGTDLVINFLPKGSNSDSRSYDLQPILRSLAYSSSSDAPPAQRTITITVNDGGGTEFDGHDTTVRTATINITPNEDTIAARADSTATPENAPVVIDLLANDVDPDGGTPDPTVATIAGFGLAPGGSVTLASGATVTYLGDGQVRYDPSGKFNELTAVGSGAVNTAATDSFVYTISNGQQATVTVTINGVVSSDDVLKGNASANTITGNASANVFDASQGGNDTLIGLDGNDEFRFGAAFTAADKVDGGDGTDTVVLNGDYTLTLGSTTLAAVERIDLRAGHDYSLTTNDANVGAGRTLTIDGHLLGAGDVLVFNGSAELSGGFIVYGGASADSITGGAGNDQLSGGAGNDQLTGGLGNDVYEVNDAGDVVTELQNQGTDRVLTSLASYLLADNVENLRGTLNSGQVLTGNSLNNDIRGGAGNDTIDGGMGADAMMGGLGNDIYYVDNAADRVTEYNDEGTDRIYASVSYSLAGQYVEELVLTGSGNINGIGNGQMNSIAGNDGNNLLNGGAGADVLVGGFGNDHYVVDDFGDVVTEAGDAGYDRVDSSISYTLTADVEFLMLTGNGEINGTGNDLANDIRGNARGNVIDGGLGADAMRGGAGNDRYIVDNVGDTVFEADGAGTDTVEASVTFSLGGQYIEILKLTGIDAIDGTGTGQANSLYGNAAANSLDGRGGADKLYGGDGNDTLRGGDGADRFYFNTALNADTNVDSIADFTAVDDAIYLDRSIFVGVNLGQLSASAFYAGTAAHDATDRIIYDKAAGALYYDADGIGGADQVLFAHVTPNTTLTVADLFGY